MKNVKPLLIAAAGGAIGMIVLSKVGMKGAKGLDMKTAALLGAATGLVVAGVTMAAPKLMPKLAA